MRIASGPLKGLETDVIRRDDGNDSIIVNISILEQHVEYSVSMGELKKMMNFRVGVMKRTIRSITEREADLSKTMSDKQ
ncbi:MAG: hypothetical protein V8T90_06235 [Victivallales bacterium]